MNLGENANSILYRSKAELKYEAYSVDMQSRRKIVKMPPWYKRKSQADGQTHWGGSILRVDRDFKYSQDLQLINREIRTRLFESFPYIDNISLQLISATRIRIVIVVNNLHHSKKRKIKKVIAQILQQCSSTSATSLKVSDQTPDA